VLLATLIALLVLSPAEAMLGNVVKLVYAHGAAMRVAMYAYLVAGALGAAHVSLRGAQFATKQSPTSQSGIASQRTLAMTARWTRATIETALFFWLLHFVVSLPAQMLAWGGISWSEPRVVSAVWILALTLLIFGVAIWIGEPMWMAIAGIANGAIAMILMRGAINVLHPIDPILGSDSITIKGFYLAIVVTTGALAFLFARDRACS
jgi:hypothetical protein